MSILIGRYSGSAESRIDEDIRNINEKGIEAYLDLMEKSNLSDGYWDFTITNVLDTSSVNNNAYNVYLAAQVNENAVAFLSKNMKISSLIEQRGDVHHIFPRKYLIENGYPQRSYNQVANLVYTEQSTNIKVGKKEPQLYLSLIKQQITDGINDISTIDNLDDITNNFNQNDIPLSIQDSTHAEYEKFLEGRRVLMAEKIKRYYKSL